MRDSSTFFILCPINQNFFSAHFLLLSSRGPDYPRLDDRMTSQLLLKHESIDWPSRASKRWKIPFGETSDARAREFEVWLHASRPTFIFRVSGRDLPLFEARESFVCLSKVAGMSNGTVCYRPRLFYGLWLFGK